MVRRHQRVQQAADERAEAAAAGEEDQSEGVERGGGGEGEDGVGEDEREAGVAREPEVFGEWGEVQAGEAEGGEVGEEEGEGQDEGGGFEGEEVGGLEGALVGHLTLLEKSGRGGEIKQGKRTLLHDHPNRFVAYCANNSWIYFPSCMKQNGTISTTTCLFVTRNSRTRRICL